MGRNLNEVGPDRPEVNANFGHPPRFSTKKVRDGIAFVRLARYTSSRSVTGCSRTAPSSPRIANASGFIQIPLSQVPRREALGSTRTLGSAALVDRVLTTRHPCGLGVRSIEC